MTEPDDAERQHDFQLTGDDPMMDQIEAAMAGRVPPHGTGSPEASPAPEARRAPKASPRGPLDPGEPAPLGHEPDASQ